MRVFKKYYTNGTYQGTYILMLKRVKWFTDCGDWFIYIYTKRYVIRFSSAGFLVDKREK